MYLITSMPNHHRPMTHMSLRCGDQPRELPPPSLQDTQHIGDPLFFSSSPLEPRHPIPSLPTHLTTSYLPNRPCRWREQRPRRIVLFFLEPFTLIHLQELPIQPFCRATFTVYETRDSPFVPPSDDAPPPTLNENDPNIYTDQELHGNLSIPPLPSTVRQQPWPCKARRGRRSRAARP